MRRLLLLFTGFALNQAQTPPPQYLQCLESRAPTYLAALNRVDACVDYDGTNETRCLASNRTFSDPDLCTVVGTSFDGGTGFCRKFTSVASQFCSLAGMDINPNILVDLSQLSDSKSETKTPVSEAGFWGAGLLSFTPELYDESCRDIVQSVVDSYLLDSQTQLLSAYVNVMCKNRDSSEDDNTLAIGLGVGLGVGIPFIGGLIYFIVKRSKTVETTESIEPFLN